MAQLKQTDGRFSIDAANAVLESGQGTILLNNSGTGQDVRVNLLNVSFPIPLEVGDVVEVLGSSILFTSNDITTYPTTGNQIAVPGETVTLAANQSVTLTSGKGTAIIDGIEVHLNKIAYPFIVANPSGATANIDIVPVGNSFVSHGAVA